MERLNKFLANSGVCSRRKADEHILAGEVKVNGARITELGIRIDPDLDIVEFQGKAVKLIDNYIYFALNKPRGVVSTAENQAGEKTVIELVPNSPRVYPVGRLDKNSEGLIILTNDGELTKELTHPSFMHSKEYKVEVRIQNKELSQNNNAGKTIERKLVSGLKIDGKFMKVDSASCLILNPEFCILTLVLHTGYNRQIRKMCAKIGLEVVKLTRTKIVNLELDSLKLSPGQYRKVNKKDIL